jgi:hypothetical protein
VQLGYAVVLLALHEPYTFRLPTQPLTVSSAFLDRVAAKLTGVVRPDVDELFAKCDPDWRAALDREAKAMSPNRPE